LHDLVAENTAFEAIAGVSENAVSLSTPGRSAEYVAATFVSGDFFRMFAVRPLHGRAIVPDDDKLGAPLACVISADLWRRRFDGNPNVIGSSVVLDSRAFTIVGVAPDWFHVGSDGDARPDLWLTFSAGPNYAANLNERGNHFLRVMGRRKTGVSFAQAQSDLTAFSQRKQEQYRDSWSRRALEMVDMHEAFVGDSKKTVLVLFAAVALVFLVVCANVASLLLARGATRRGEMATRSALGATRGRLIMQLATESVVLFSLGGAGGVLVAHWLVDFFAGAVVKPNWAATPVLDVDLGAAGFAAVVALICGVVFGLIPALSTSRVEPQAVLKDTAVQAGVSHSQRFVRGALVVAQVALAFALLVGSGLAMRAFSKVSSTPLGFDASGLAVARVTLPMTKYDDRASIQFWDRYLERLKAQPGITAVAMNDSMPMLGWNSNGGFKIEGRPQWAPGEGPILERNIVSPGYFAAMGIPVLRGRELTTADVQESRHVMVVDELFVQRFFPNEDPIGKRLDLSSQKDDEYWEIVGVVGNIRKFGFSEAIPIEAYVPYAQRVRPYMGLAVRSANPTVALEQMRRELQAMDPERSLFETGLMEAKAASTIQQQKFLTTLLGAFSVAALLLATMGLFGFVSYATSQRTRELGIRMALGSSPGAVVGLVVRGGARLVAIGLAIGLVGAILVGRALAAHVQGVVSFDPVVFGAIPIGLAAVGLLSCVLPAWRAVRIPPSVALRYE
jgi:putative ABC transport system permease protein